METLYGAPTITSGMKRFLAGKSIAGKHARDALRLSLYARGYIELDSHGNVARSVLRPEAPAAIIAVVAPREHGHALVLEIGLNRTTPYRQIEYRTKSGAVASIAARERFRAISTEEFPVVIPTIELMLERLLLAQRERWRPKSREEWWVKGASRPVHKGIGIRVDRRDTEMYRQMLLEDIRHRERQLRRLLSVITYRLRSYRFTSGYSDKQLRSFAGAARVAEALSPDYDVPLHLAVTIERALGAFSGGKYWSVCEQIIRAYRIRRPDEEACVAMNDLLYGRKSAPLFKRIRARLVEERAERKRHGQGCLTIEVVPTDTLLREEEVPF